MRVALAAKLKAARAILGWSQTELGKRAGVTQRAVHQIEIAAVQARLSTQAQLNEAIRRAGIWFEPLPRGGFKLLVSGNLLAGPRRRPAAQR
jgi:transcriptional regulator with XRE-family HTH domain